MLPKIILLAIVGFVVCSPVTTKIEDLVKQTYENVMNGEVENGVDKNTVLQLPIEIQELIKHVTQDQLPLITSQIKEDAKEHSTDLEQFVERKVREYIEPMRIKEFVLEHLTRHRRDDDEMPNYLDHFYGGLGR